MQLLQVKLPDKTTTTVKVHRSWQDISGRHIFLHHNGVYGYKDGSPIQSIQEIDGLLPPEHRKQALAWWNRAGREMAAEFYGRKEEESSKSAGDFQEAMAAEEFNTRLDSILYSRRGISRGKKRGAVSSPKPWMEFGFNRRPDWWGQAKEISFPDFLYVMLEPESEDSSPSEAGNPRVESPAPLSEPGMPTDTSPGFPCDAASGIEGI